ncbi:hypothetical protein G8C92_07875 [Paenibacillus donghaensis]|jgi:hypothetical protein|uniref:hypothetical protein n=1 Tax=Paenibacillus donghaensis TaxID=414771 RepID=UPI001884377C|nr:hypothetical protein [Paenibacillus donghaensis]MBE9913952.1 hypothetical protein [Paenibacillus donghaensis]
MRHFKSGVTEGRPHLPIRRFSRLLEDLRHLPDRMESITAKFTILAASIATKR